MAYGLSNGNVTDDVTWPQRCCEAVRSAILATTWLLVNYDINIATYDVFVWRPQVESEWWASQAQVTAWRSPRVTFAYGLFVLSTHHFISISMVTSAAAEAVGIEADFPESVHYSSRESVRFDIDHRDSFLLPHITNTNSWHGNSSTVQTCFQTVTT